MRDGHQKERLGNAKTHARDNSLEESDVPRLLNNMLECPNETTRGEALGTIGLSFNAHDLEGLIPCAQSASNNATESFFRDAELDVLHGLAILNMAALEHVANHVGEALSGGPVRALSHDESSAAMVEAADATGLVSPDSLLDNADGLVTGDGSGDQEGTLNQEGEETVINGIGEWRDERMGGMEEWGEGRLEHTGPMTVT